MEAQFSQEKCEKLLEQFAKLGDGEGPVSVEYVLDTPIYNAAVVQFRS